MSVEVASMKFWINAFIPRDIATYTKAVPRGPDKGKTMIPGPRIHSRLQTTDCYLTDQRSFDNYIHAQSRMHSEFRIDFSGPEPRMTEYHNCDLTTEVDCEDGDCECKKKGDESRMAFILIKQDGGKRAIVEMKCAASNPCAPTSRYFGNIGYSGRITMDAAARTVEFDGCIDQFPAFEAYATINDQAGVALFRLPPPRGKTVMNLAGTEDRPIKSKLVDRNGDGVFEEQTDS